MPLPGTPTAAKWVSRDNDYRMEVQFDGGPEWVHYRRDRQGDLMDEVVAIITPSAYAYAQKPGTEFMDIITDKFWERVANHYGVSADRARTHIMINGAPAAVQTLWTKATTFMDSAGTTEDAIKDNGNW